MPNFPLPMPGSQPDMQPQQPQSGLRQAMPQMVQAAIAMLAAKQAGPQAAAAFLAGMQQSKARAESQQRQGVLDQSTLQTQQAQRDNLANDNRLADQRFGLEQVTTAQKALDPFIQQTADSATDPVEAENAVMQRATGLSSAMGLPPDRLSGLVPNMAPILSARDKKNAKTVVENIDKNPLYAGYLKTPEGQQQLDAMNVQWKGGTTKLGKLRELAGGRPTTDTGEPFAPNPVDPEASTAGSFDAQFNDVLAATEAQRGKKLTPQERADLRLQAKKAYDAANDQPKGEPRNRFNIQVYTKPDGTTGFIRVNMDTGDASPVTLPEGGGAGNATDTQRLSAGYYKRTLGAEANIAAFESKLTSLGDQADLQLPNLLKSEQGQQYAQGRDEFINAALRRESGAAIQPSEYTRYDKIYFVRPGDTAAVIKQKQEARKRVIEGFRITAGNLAGKDAGGVDVKDPTGATHHFDTPAQADAFKKLAGIP